MRDIKDTIQMRADEIAQELFEADFYDLPQHTRDIVYNQALQEITGGD
jgi:hypothetical protein